VKKISGTFKHMDALAIRYLLSYPIVPNLSWLVVQCLNRQSFSSVYLVQHLPAKPPGRTFSATSSPLASCAFLMATPSAKSSTRCQSSMAILMPTDLTAWTSRRGLQENGSHPGPSESESWLDANRLQKLAGRFIPG